MPGELWMSKSVIFYLEWGFPFAGSILLPTRERDMDIIFTCLSRPLKSKCSFPEIETEKKPKAVASGSTSGSTLLRLGGQITEPSSPYAVWFQLHPKLHEIQMRHLLKGAWFYVAQLTVYWNTLNKNINTGEETWRPLGTPDPNAGWINSNLAPFSLRWSKQEPLKVTMKPRPSLCVSLLKISYCCLKD